MKPYFYLLIATAIMFIGACKSKKQVLKDIPKEFITQGPEGLDTIKIYTATPQKQPVREVIITEKDRYELAFRDLSDMLNGSVELDFERAVFLSENPYHNGRFSYIDFQERVSSHLLTIKGIIAAKDKSDTIDFDAKVNEHGRFALKDLRYLPEQKKELYRQALSNWAIFKYLTDTITNMVIIDSALSVLWHFPYSYSTNDPFGMKDWSNSQVINLLMLDNNRGNCFALTGLFKIFSDRLKANAKICTAPQHIYIQHQDPKGQYYNVELATAGHPADGIIQTLTYTPSDAIRSGIALRDYTTKQSIGLCLVNLAKSYEHKFHTKNDPFMLRCAELALQYDSVNLNALLLKAQILDAQVTSYATKQHINNIETLKADKSISSITIKLESHLGKLTAFGYRQMPVDMQELIMNPLQYDPQKWDHKTRNPRPFTSIKVLDPKDEEYWTLTKGMFQEVFAPMKIETYGHFSIDACTKKLVRMDTSAVKGFIIDPVAFAYDFGARMYDATRIGHFVSIDPLANKYPMMSPYVFVADNPIYYVDPDGREIRPSKAFLASSYNPVLNNLLANNTIFNTIVGEFNQQGKFNVILDGNEGNLRGSTEQGRARTIEDKQEIFGFSTKSGLKSRIDFRLSQEKNYNDLGKAALLIHEFIHLYSSKQKLENNQKFGDDTKHEEWDDYMYMMRQSLQEYSNDNKLNLSFDQINEISISYAGSEASIYKDYVKSMSEKNKTDIDTETKALQSRVSSLISSKKKSD